MSQYSADLTWQFGDADFGLASHGLVHSDPAWRSLAGASYANLRWPHIFKHRIYGKKKKNSSCIRANTVVNFLQHLAAYTAWICVHYKYHYMHLCLHCFDVAPFTFSPHQVAVTEARVTIANVWKQGKNIQGTCYVSIKHNCLFFI
jgi:hypothetical protein